MSKKSTRIQAAKDTLEALEKGFYTNHNGEKVLIGEAFYLAKGVSRLYKPESFGEVFAQRDVLLASVPRVETRFEVVNETSLQAASRLVRQGQPRVLCLNFASAKNPGGGFLNGAQAQEESLARASALYPCLAQMQEMYNANRQHHSCLYTDHMIYSPDVPVFRDDDNQWLAAPYPVSFVTAPAVNAGVVKQQGKRQEMAQIEATMRTRTQKVLSIAVLHQHRVLVLGAWGCGVFQNDPALVAECFRHHLVDNPVFKGIFETVVFAVLDHSKEGKTIRPFQERFTSLA